MSSMFAGAFPEETNIAIINSDKPNKLKRIELGDKFEVPKGYNKVVSASGNTIILTKDKPDNAYIPYTGVKENFTVGIVLALVILYSRRNLRRNSVNSKFKTASKRSFRK